MNAGSEVDAYCSKCKLDLGHRIVAMVGDKIVKAECQTCLRQHKYREPKGITEAGQEPPPKEKKSKAKTEDKASKLKAKIEAKKEAKRSEEEEMAREAWKVAIAPCPPDGFTPYSMSMNLEDGQFIHHHKFDAGVVVEILESGKARILFERGLKTLVYGR